MESFLNTTDWLFFTICIDRANFEAFALAVITQELRKIGVSAKDILFTSTNFAFWALNVQQKVSSYF
jgi:hypothetical protein